MNLYLFHGRWKQKVRKKTILDFGQNLTGWVEFDCALPEGEWKSLDPACQKYHFTAYHLRSDFNQIGTIVTGDQKVNQLFSNALWSQKDNFLDVPVDCPQWDERPGWTGDVKVFSETACYNIKFFSAFLMPDAIKYESKPI